MEISNKDLIYCINAEKAPDLFSYLTRDNYIINCSYIPLKEKEEDNNSINTEELIPNNNNQITSIINNGNIQNIKASKPINKFN